MIIHSSTYFVIIVRPGIIHCPKVKVNIRLIHLDHQLESLTCSKLLRHVLKGEGEVGIQLHISLVQVRPPTLEQHSNLL